MRVRWTPLRWPAAWTDPACLALLRGTSIDTILVDNSDELEPVRAVAEQQGLQVTHPDTPPDGVTAAKGVWPGVRRARRGDADAGPTGVPWVDSNGWLVQLTAARHPGSQVWIDAKPPDFPNYLMAIADCAAYGGRWIVTLDDALADGIAARAPRAMEKWKAIGQATAFFGAHEKWNEAAPAALAGVVSDFAGPNEFFSQELLNLLARAGLHALPLPKDKLTREACAGLRALIYADTQPPSPELHRLMSGIPAVPVVPDDPYATVQEAWKAISHRHDLVRFWNAGAAASYVTASAGSAVVQLLFFADRGPDAASVRIAGPYRHVKASTVDTAALTIQTVEQKDAIEVHLPQVSQYVALELSV